jgi:putative inorganic carbon (HCO3(-)) transporter
VSAREAAFAVALLVITAPILAFPAVLGPGNAAVAAAIVIGVLVASVIFARHFSFLPWLAAPFAAAVIAGWMRSPGQTAGLNHFGGIALGLLAMVAIAGWCRTRGRLAIATAAFLAFGMFALSVGYRSTPAIHKRKVFLSDTTAVPPPIIPLPMSGLHERDVVNPNALSAMAMMILPVGAAVALAGAPGITWPAVLRLIGLASAFWAAAIVAMMQSRSAWLAAVCVTWLWMRTRLGPRAWRAASVVIFLVVPGVMYLLWSDHPRSAELVATIAGRMNIWDDALDALSSAPWLGIGLDYFRDSGYSMVLWPPNELVGTPHAHNILLQTALDIGLLGLVCYMALIAFILLRGLEIAGAPQADPLTKYVCVGAALSIVAVHAYGLLDAVSLGTKVGVFQWLASGLVLAAWQLERRTT